MTHVYHLTRVSGNKKAGPIPASTTSKTSCPDVCPLKNNGCYADSGPLALHWRAVTAGARGDDLSGFCQKIAKLPKQQLWRYGQAGDLPGDGARIDASALAQIVEANKGRRGFAYTHYSPTVTQNAQNIRDANAAGFVINLSANNLEHADELADLGIAPVVTLLPPEQTTNTHTPTGRLVAICPAVVRDDIDCSTCGICATNRSAIIGFPAHGSGAKRAAQVFHARRSKRDTERDTHNDAQPCITT